MQTTTVLTPGGQLAGGVPVQNVVIIPSYGEAQIWTNYASKTSYKLGVTQIVIGVHCIAFNITAIVKNTFMTSFGPGIFGGLFVSSLHVQEICLCLEAFVIMTSNCNTKWQLTHSHRQHMWAICNAH